LKRPVEYTLLEERKFGQSVQKHEGGWVLGVVGNREGQEEKPIDLDRPEILSDEDDI
jgi:hypothetical protein